MCQDGRCATVDIGDVECPLTVDPSHSAGRQVSLPHVAVHSAQHCRAVKWSTRFGCIVPDLLHGRRVMMRDQQISHTIMIYKRSVTPPLGTSDMSTLLACLLLP